MKDSIHNHLSQLTIERFLLGELSSSEERNVSRAEQECVLCRETVADTRADNNAFTMRPIPQGIRTLTATRRQRSPWLAGLFVVVPTAAAAVVAVMLAVNIGDSNAGAESGFATIGSRGKEPVIRLKGDGPSSTGSEAELEFGFYIKRGSDSIIGQPGQLLKKGDRIQFWYNAPVAEPAVLVGIDGHGQVTRYNPQNGTSPIMLETGKGRVLDTSIVLDDAIGVERFFLCASAEAVSDMDRVEVAAKELAGSGVDMAIVDRLPLGCRQGSIWIRKE